MRGCWTLLNLIKVLIEIRSLIKITFIKNFWFLREVIITGKFLNKQSISIWSFILESLASMKHLFSAIDEYFFICLLDNPWGSISSLLHFKLMKLFPMSNSNLNMKHLCHYISTFLTVALFLHFFSLFPFLIFIIKSSFIISALMKLAWATIYVKQEVFLWLSLEELGFP